MSTTSDYELSDALLEATEIVIEKSDSDDMDDFSLNMEKSERNSNMTDTSQDEVKLEIKQETTDENEARNDYI